MSATVLSVAFHTGVADPVEHALRLTRKALALGSRVLVLGTAERLGELDSQLWTADPGSFTPHMRWSPQAANESRLQRAPVWLCSEPQDLPTEGQAWGMPDVLINMGISVPGQADRFAKVFEIVSNEPAARVAGQQRWRVWRDKGLTPVHHAFS